MSFTPKYRALFASAVADQAIALLQRDFASAIAALTPAAMRSYNGFVDYKKNLDGSAINCPAVVVAVRQTALMNPSDAGTRPQQHRLLLRPEVEDQDPQFAAQAAYDYIRALDQVISSSLIPDWEDPLPIVHATRTATMTEGLAGAGGHVLDVWVETHDYGVLWETPGGFGMRPAMTVVLEVEEL